MFALGLRLYRGDGITKQWGEASEWFLKAANKGHAICGGLLHQRAWS